MRKHVHSVHLTETEHCFCCMGTCYAVIFMFDYDFTEYYSKYLIIYMNVLHVVRFVYNPSKKNECHTNNKIALIK